MILGIGDGLVFSLESKCFFIKWHFHHHGACSESLVCSIVNTAAVRGCEGGLGSNSRDYENMV